MPKPLPLTTASLLLAFLILTVPAVLKPVLADQPASVNMTANPDIILADGKSTTTINIVCTLAGGKAAPDGTVVSLTTSSGTLSDSTVNTIDGLARVTLTSSQITGKAVVMATFNGGGTGASGQVEVEFTIDKSVANSDQSDQDWIHVSSRGYLAYGADDQTVDAYSKQQGVHFSYRGVSIEADAMQVDLATNVVKARNAILSEGLTQVVDADELRFEYMNRDGTAVVTDSSRGSTIQSVHFSGVDLKPEVEKKPSRRGSDYEFIDLSGDRVLVTAQSVTIKPGDTIQLRRATVFLDGKKIVSLPFHTMPLTTNQVFGQQILGYGTNGFYVNVPYYLSLSPHDSSTFYLRSPAASLASGTFTTTSSAFVLDFDHSYQLKGNSGSGDFQLDGLQQGVPGVEWRQTDLFGPLTHTYVDIDVPTPSQISTTEDLTHQFKWFSANLSNSYSHSDSFGDYSLDSERSTAYFETKPRVLAGPPSRAIQYVADLTFSGGVSVQTVPTSANDLTSSTVRTPFSTSSVSTRFFTPTYNLNRQTTISNAINFGDSYDSVSHLGGFAVLATSGLKWKLSKVSTMSLNYNFDRDPTREETLFENGTIVTAPLLNSHQFGLTYFTGAPNGKWDLAFTSNYLLPTDTMSLTGGFNYRQSGWQFGAEQTISRALGFLYNDFDLVASHKIGGRDLAVSWGTVDHHFRINMESAQF